MKEQPKSRETMPSRSEFSSDEEYSTAMTIYLAENAKESKRPSWEEFWSYLKREGEGHTEFRLVLYENKTAYIHVMNRDSESLNFELPKVDWEDGKRRSSFELSPEWTEEEYEWASDLTKELRYDSNLGTDGKKRVISHLRKWISRVSGEPPKPDPFTQSRDVLRGEMRSVNEAIEIGDSQFSPMCMNSHLTYPWPASFLANDNQECCECGNCEIEINGKRFNEKQYREFVIAKWQLLAEEKRKHCEKLSGEADCPLCENGKGKLLTAPMKLTVNKQRIEIESLFYKCDSCKGEWTTNDIDEINVKKGYEVSGEAKTPDLTQGEKIVVDQAIKYLDDSLEPFHANTIRLLLRKLTGGSVPTPDQIERLGMDYEAKSLNTQSNTGADARSFSDGYEKAIRELRTVPTPSDEEIEKKARAYGEAFKTGEWFENIRVEAFTRGAKWVKEWLRSSTERK